MGEGPVNRGRGSRHHGRAVVVEKPFGRGPHTPWNVTPWVNLLLPIYCPAFGIILTFNRFLVLLALNLRWWNAQCLKK